jgi:hypothetical protein
MSRRIFFVAVLALVTVAAVAQPLPSGRWWRMPKIVETLELNGEQQDRLDAIFRGAANDLIDRKAEVEKANIALRTELDQRQLDRQAIQQAATRLNQARGRLFDRELMMLVDMRGVLNEEQWTRLRTELDRARGNKQRQGVRR